MGKPVERQNHVLSFFILATLIAICTAWSFYDEYIGRRPWKDYQEKIFSYDREKARLDLRFFERKLETGDIKVADPSKPGETLTVADARKRLDALTADLAKNRGEISKLDKQLTEARIEATDADLKVKYLRSEDDGLFYELQHAQHQEMLHRATAAKLAAAGDKSGADAEAKQGEAKAKVVAEVTKQREKKAAEIKQAEVEAVEATQRLADLEAKREALVGAHDKLKMSIDAAVEPVTTAKTGLEKVLDKRTELTQYWLTSYDNSVDRCQNCHASVDKCGFSRPHEVVEAFNAPNAKQEEVPTLFCINPDTLAHYNDAANEVCPIELDEAASAAGKIEGGRCFTGEERERVAGFFMNYCGPRAAAFKVLGDRHLTHACVGGEGWTKLASYVEDVAQKGACDLELKPEGEVCVEGVRRDHLISYLSQHCNVEISKTLKGLRASAKACASGEQGKKLEALRPVLYDFPVWAQTHPHRAELLTAAHPPERFGCTSCHEGQGAQTKGVAGSPFTHGYDDHYWERPMLDLVSHKRFRPKTWGPPPPNEGVPGEWVQHENQYNQSSCAKCHTEEVNLKYADTYSRGRKLIADIGCHGCHPVDAFADFPKLGPILTDLREKTNPQFLMTWIAFPKSFRPRTKMPNFWPEALDSHLRVREGSPELAQREDEVRKIAAFLWKTSNQPNLPPLPVRGEASRGQLLVQQVGCRACHNFVPVEKLCSAEQIAAGKSRGTPSQPGECEVARSLTGSDARDFAPNLSNVGLKANERWLFAWVKNPTSLWPQSRMPNLRLTDQEAADITAYLLTLKEGPALSNMKAFDERSPELEQLAQEGDKLVTRYGCAGCHDIKGHENDPKIGTDLNEYGRKTVDLLDFGNAVPNPRHHSWFNFVDLKLRAPRAYRYERVETRMPQFDLNDDEVNSLMVFLKSRTGDKVPASYQVWRNERLASIAQGDQVMEYFNCKGCHVIDGDGGRVRDVYTEDDVAMAPPVLHQQGWRVQPDWFFGFLHDPSEKLRPWLDIRMPTFPLGDKRNTALVRGFAARANVSYPYLTVETPRMSPAEFAEAKKMVDTTLNCFKCHTAGKPNPDQDRASLAPDLRIARQRLRPDWVGAWLKNPQALQEGTRMPNFFTPDDMTAVMYPDYFGGSQEKQIEALRDYVMMLGTESNEASEPQANRAPQRPGRRGR